MGNFSAQIHYEMDVLEGLGFPIQNVPAWGSCFQFAG